MDPEEANEPAAEVDPTPVVVELAGSVDTTVTDDEASGAAGAAVATSPAAMPARYSRLVHAFYDHPWAVTPSMFKLMASILDFRVGGGILARDEILARLDAAKADNGPRGGGATSGGIRVIPFYGVVSQRQSLMADTSGGTSCDAIRGELHAALDDPSISAILFDVDSPGGDV